MGMEYIFERPTYLHITGKPAREERSHATAVPPV
jgi:hypothetical protein